MSHSYTNLNYHLVFATKGREPWLDDGLRAAVFEQLGAILRKERVTPVRINGMPDHVHLLVKLRPEQNVAEVVCDLKSRSTGWVHRNRPDLPHFSWQAGYGAFTVSQSQVEVVSRYIENQEQHHRETTFQREYLVLLEKHGFDVDEKTVWD